MAHFAEIDDQNVVLRVLVVSDEFEDCGEDYLANELGLGGKWIQTSYNSRIRGKYAGTGDLYDPKKDIFYSPAPIEPEVIPEASIAEVPADEPTDV